jgi:hypothetical protein
VKRAILLACLVLASCVQDSSAPQSQEQATAKTVHARNFSSVLDTTFSQYLYDAHAQAATPNWQITPYAELAPGEKQLLDGWQLPERRGGGDLITTMLFVNEYQAANGRFPRDGQELVEWQFEQQGIPASRLSASGLEEQLALVSYAVNPLTGELFSSFSSPQWMAGGLYLAKLESPEELRKVFWEKDGSSYQRPENLREAWLLRVYGNESNEIILERPILILKGRS